MKGIAKKTGQYCCKKCGWKVVVLKGCDLEICHCGSKKWKFLGAIVNPNETVDRQTVDKYVNEVLDGYCEKCGHSVTKQTSGGTHGFKCPHCGHSQVFSQPKIG